MNNRVISIEEVRWAVNEVVPVFFRTVLPRPSGLSPGEGWDAVHDAVGVNCKKGTTTEYQGAGTKYMG